MITSVTQKNVPSALLYYYCAWYVFLRNRRYIWSNRCHETILYPKLFPYISELVVETLIVEF